ncbi:hypothetical protein BDZ89DRAFT_259942 [Hymenopellis radicata]|nr:hypothetical protein BDZ89DRAFT_259942 [Hymenopellis radicata]
MARVHKSFSAVYQARDCFCLMQFTLPYQPSWRVFLRRVRFMCPYGEARLCGSPSAEVISSMLVSGGMTAVWRWTRI